MNADEKNAHIEAAKVAMSSAIGLVVVEVFSGLAVAPGLMLAAAALIRATGDESHAAEAEVRAAECPAILLIPWPFIYIGSNAWIAAVAQLRDSLPYYIPLEPVDAERRSESHRRGREEKAARCRAKWDALTEAQQAELERVGIDPKRLDALG
jgi:hypothetical protein